LAVDNNMRQDSNATAFDRYLPPQRSDESFTIKARFEAAKKSLVHFKDYFQFAVAVVLDNPRLLPKNVAPLCMLDRDQPNGRSFLFTSATVGERNKVFEALLNNKDVVDFWEASDDSLIHVALDVQGIRPYHIAKICEVFDPNTRNVFGQTPLHVVVSSAWGEAGLDKLQALLATPGIDINARDHYGKTPVHDLAWRLFAELDLRFREPTPSLDALDVLFDSGADLYAFDDGGETAYDHLRSTIEHPRIRDFLAKVQKKELLEAVEKQMSEGPTFDGSLVRERKRRLM